VSRIKIRRDTMSNWATQYMQMKTAQAKTAGHIWNAVGGGIPYAVSKAYHTDAIAREQDLTPGQRAKVLGGVVAPLASGYRAMLPALGYSLAGAGIGALGGAAVGEVVGGTNHDVFEMAGAGGVGGGLLGALGGHIKGSVDNAGNYAREEAAELQKPEEERKSFLARHPVLGYGSIGALAAPVLAGGVANVVQSM
jgi:hypothetical protein